MFTNVLSSLLSLFYPNCCLICNDKLVENERNICLNCLLNLPQTNYHLQEENRVTDRLKGKIPYERATAFLHYNKGGIAQKITANIKYKGFSDFGLQMGKYAAETIMRGSSFFEGIDLLVPIPLHPKKKRSRGFNQAEQIAEGIYSATDIPMDRTIVLRKNQNQTQTKKGRYERWMNSENIFECVFHKNLENKHLLIVDDVLTTGSTIEACVESILSKYTTVKISIFTLSAT